MLDKPCLSAVLTCMDLKRLAIQSIDELLSSYKGKWPNQAARWTRTRRDPISRHLLEAAEHCGAPNDAVEHNKSIRW